MVVEDSPTFVGIVRDALGRVDRSVRIEVADDGQSALDYLAGMAPYNDRNRFPLPDLILLDLHLPNVNGFQVLEWVRTEPTLRHLPVVILAASSYSTDIKRAYAFGANSFITKPQSIDQLVRELQVALDFWLYKKAVPPPKPQDPEWRNAA